MSQPDTDLQKQARWHAGPLMGLGLVLVFALLALLWWLFYEADAGNTPQGANVQVDGRTGEVEPQAPEVSPSQEAIPGQGGATGGTRAARSTGDAADTSP